MRWYRKLFTVCCSVFTVVYSVLRLFAVVYNLHTTKKRRQWLDMMPFEQVKELFIEIKKEYYNQTPIKF